MKIKIKTWIGLDNIQEKMPKDVVKWCLSKNFDRCPCLVANGHWDCGSMYKRLRMYLGKEKRDPSWFKKRNAANLEKNAMIAVAFNSKTSKPVGWSMIELEPDTIDRTFSMYVPPRNRGNGIGLLLLKNAISKIDAKRLYVHMTDVSEKFYLKHFSTKYGTYTKKRMEMLLKHMPNRKNK